MIKLKLNAVIYLKFEGPRLFGTKNKLKSITTLFNIYPTYFHLLGTTTNGSHCCL